MATIVNTASSPRLLCIDTRPLPAADDAKACEAYDKGKPKEVKLRLDVGANLVDDELWLRFCDNPFVAKLVASGTLREQDNPQESETFTPGRYVDDLSKLKKDDAIEAINACTNEKQLRAWIDQDPRPAIRKALITRHRVLVPPPKQEEDVSALHAV